MSPIPPGPLFASTFNSTDFGLKNPTGGSSSTATTSAASGGGIFQTIGNAYSNSGLPKGSIAAAVIVPLIAVAIGIAVYVKFQRTKEAERRKRWSQAVDKRMSTISTEWKGLPPSAQSEAIRQSIAIMRDSRASIARMSQLCGEGRPSSTFSSEGGQAGVGARRGTGVGLRNPAMGSAHMSERKSTVSFAADTRFSSTRPSVELSKPAPRPSTDKMRPSTDTQRGRASRAFHTAISANQADHDSMDAMMSPTQMGGPVMLGDRDIRQLELGKDDSVMPALHSEFCAAVRLVGFSHHPSDAPAGIRESRRQLSHAGTLTHRSLQLAHHTSLRDAPEPHVRHALHHGHALQCFLRQRSSCSLTVGEQSFRRLHARPV